MLGGVDTWNALFAVRFHFLRFKFSAVAEHAVRYIFVEVDVNPFDGSVLHGFAGNCIGKRVVAFF